MPRPKPTRDRSIRKASGKGYLKRKSTVFPKGVSSKFPKKEEDIVSSDMSDQGSNIGNDDNNIKLIKRHDQVHFEDLVIESPANPLSIPDVDGQDGDAMILRPRKPSTHSTPGHNDITERKGTSSSSPTGQYNIEVGSILVEKSNLLELINGFSRTHYDTNECVDLCLDIVDIQPSGLFSSVVLTCTSCGSRSQWTKLYKEVETTNRGRKAAEGNLRLASIVQDMPIGPTETQLLFAAVGIRAGSLSSL